MRPPDAFAAIGRGFLLRQVLGELIDGQHTGTAEAASCCGVLLAQNAEQLDRERPGPVDEISADPGSVPFAF
jgi:hypothetical protein